jgi:soluble lytic murein transglycosylase-like protein
MLFSGGTSISSVSLPSQIGLQSRISNNLLPKFLLPLFLLLSSAGVRAQTSQADVLHRMESSTQRQQLSITRQRKSIAGTAKAAGSNGFFLRPFPPTAHPFLPVSQPIQMAGQSGQPECAALPAVEVDNLVTQAGEATSVSPDLLRSVMKEESGFRPCAVSGKGAMGLMQLMESTAAQFGVKNAFDPQENVTAGASLLKQLINLYKGDLGLALSAYNAGPGKVDPSFGIPDIPETKGYVDRILSLVEAGH